MYWFKVKIMLVILRALWSIVSNFIAKCVATLYSHTCVECSCGFGVIVRPM